MRRRNKQRNAPKASHLYIMCGAIRSRARLRYLLKLRWALVRVARRLLFWDESSADGRGFDIGKPCRGLRVACGIVDVDAAPLFIGVDPGVGTEDEGGGKDGVSAILKLKPRELLRGRRFTSSATAETIHHVQGC